jgi:hypothetical protein
MNEQGALARPELGRMADLWRIERSWQPRTTLQEMTAQSPTATLPCKRRINEVSKVAYEVREELSAVPGRCQAYIRSVDGSVYLAIYRLEERELST